MNRKIKHLLLSVVVLSSVATFNSVKADELSDKLTEITINQSKLEYKASEIEEKIKKMEETTLDAKTSVDVFSLVKQSEAYKILEKELQATKADIIHVKSVRKNIEKEVKKAEEARKAAEEKARKEAEEKARKEAEAKAEKERILSIAVDTDAGETNMMAETGYIKVGTEAYKVHPTSGSYPIGQCTWGAKALAPWVGDWWGDAGNWLNSARKYGFETGTTPRVGSLVVWTGGTWGHVGYVVGVSGDKIQILEANYGGTGYVANPRGIGNYRGWFNPVESGVAGYIYPKG